MGVCFSWGWRIANRSRESWWGEGQLCFWRVGGGRVGVFSSRFCSLRKEERASHHQNREK